MRSILIKVGIFLSLFGIVLASVLEPRGDNSPHLPDGFQCGDAVFTGSLLKEVAKKVKSKARTVWFTSRRLSKLYDGPPFTRPYLVWPISLKTESYTKAMSGPYRAIINENFEIFSVVAKRPNGIQECSMIGPVAQHHVNYHYKCGNHDFPRDMLLSAVEVACFDIQKIATQKFPARYDGPHFSEFGKQRYIYPIRLDEAFRQGSDPGPYRVVINSACKLVGAITVYNHGEIFPCAQTRKAS